MDLVDAVKNRLEVREFADRTVPSEIKREILEAARLSPSAMNSQKWHFVLVDKKENMKKLADLSMTGKWIAGANLAVVVLTNPRDPYHMFDAARALTNMQLTAWGRGVGSGMYTGYKQEDMAGLLNIPAGYEATVVVGFGYPAKKTRGKKKRLPLQKVASHQKYGSAITNL